MKEGRGYACGQGALGRGLESGLEGGLWVGGSGCFYSLWVVCHIQTIFSKLQSGCSLLQV